MFTVNHVANLAGSALCEVLFAKGSLRDEVHDTEIVSDRTLLPKQVLADIPRRERERTGKNRLLQKEMALTVFIPT